MSATPYGVVTCEKCGSADRPAGSSLCHRCLEPVAVANAPDLVNHPPHYKSGGMEVIDIIEAFDLDFCLGNTVKYVLRAGKKSGEESLTALLKAQWYINRAISQAKKRGQP